MNEIKDARLPYCVERIYAEGIYVIVVLKGSVIMAEHLDLINYVLAERLLYLYSIDYTPLTGHLQLTYWG